MGYVQVAHQRSIEYQMKKSVSNKFDLVGVRDLTCICLTHGSNYPVNTEPNYRNPQNTGFVWGKIIIFAAYENERI